MNDNVALQISAVKKALLEGSGRADTHVLLPPAPLPAVSAAARNSTSSPLPSAGPPQSPFIMPKTRKDLLASSLALQENINPNLNGPTAAALANQTN